VETRYIERLADGSWRFATYVWNEDGSDATLAPARGIRAHAVSEAPGGVYPIPSQDDCRACHGTSGTPVLGVGTLQLSSDRDPLAPHAEPLARGDATLESLHARGWLRNLPAALLTRPPRIDAPSADARAVLGYLHANCGSCHRRDDGDDPTVPVELLLHHDVAAAAEPEQRLRALLDRPARFRPHAASGPMALIAGGDPDASVLVLRMRERSPLSRMPPLGSRVADTDGIAALERWIRHSFTDPEETPR
jgi:hypothetical protein